MPRWLMPVQLIKARAKLDQFHSKLEQCFEALVEAVASGTLDQPELQELNSQLSNSGFKTYVGVSSCYELPSSFR